MEIFLRPHVDQLDSELALHGSDPSAAEASILEVADALSTNPRFDAWGEGLFRLERIAAEARRAGRPRLAADITEKMKKIDSGYAPGALRASRAALR